MQRTLRYALATLLALGSSAVAGEAALAQAAPAPAAAPTAANGPTFQAPPAPGRGITLQVDGEEVGYATAIKVLLGLASLVFAPAIVLSMTSFTRIIVVLALLRQAVGVVQLPPSRVLVGMALFLTLFTMTPVLRQIDAQALTPYQAGELSEADALAQALKPLRRFMLRHTREDDLALFLHIMHETEKPKTAADVPTVAVVPAFMLSELKTAFQIGALLFIPFLVIDLVVASVLMSMGMMMLPPATISLPLKLVVFVLVDGWGLVVTSLATSFTT